MTEQTPITFADVSEAAQRIAGSVIRSPFVRSLTLSNITGADIWLKLESLQFTSSFKERGAANKLLTLPADERKRGVIAMSAGNHAQGLAYHAERLGIAATIVMPKSTPFVKVSRTRHHGARVLLEGDTLAEAAAFAQEVAATEKLIFVHPYNDPKVIAGQGTVGLEMLQDKADLDCIVVPVGGGGLVAGTAIAADGLKRKVEIVGVEVENYAAAAQMLAGRPVAIRGGATIAEGIAVRDVGALPISILRAHGVEVVAVSEQLIERALVLMLEIEKTVVEGAAAAALAAVLAESCALCRAKSRADPDRRQHRHARAGQRADAWSRARRAVDPPVDRGAGQARRLGGLTQAVAELGGNIVEVQHQRIFGTVSANVVEVELLVEVEDAAQGETIVKALEGRAVKVRRLAHSGG